VVVTEERRGELSVDNAGAGGVMVVFVGSFGLCYGSAAIAMSTRLFNVKIEVVFKRIAFFFCTCVAGNR